MTNYLVMRLYGPLASWGEIAVGEQRHSAVHPSRSALIGLIGAALGIERDAVASQAALASRYLFGIKLECIGSPLRDYHTVQSGVPPRKTRFRTRRQELQADKVDTLLSYREYRCDSLSTVAVQALDGAPYTLTRLAEALDSPRFPLYLGRKSCPLALPLAPSVVQAESLRAALDAPGRGSLLALAERDPNRAWPAPADRRFLRPGPPRYYWQDGMQAGMTSMFDTVRHDQPLSRQRWQFSSRHERVFVESEGPK